MRILVGIAAAVVVWAQGTTPKQTAAEYPVQGKAGNVTVGAEYMVHSFGTGEQMFVAENFLVVEVALFPPKGEMVAVDLMEFALRVNGKKEKLSPALPTMVAASLSHPEWRQRPTMDIGAGPIGVGLGYPPNRPPFPGAPAPQPRYPNPPRSPDADPPGGMDKRETATAPELLVRTALPTEPHRGPISGYLFFPYTGKTSSIKSLELTWREASLKLR